MDACTIQFPRRTADAIERLYLDGRPGFDDLIELAVGGDCAASYAVGTALQGAAENRLPPVDRDPLADFSVDTLLERSWAWKEEAAERGNVEAMQELYVAYSEGAAGLERDVLAYMAASYLDIRPGLLTSLFGMTRRYAYREMQFRSLMVQGQPRQVVSGSELLSVMTRVAAEVDLRNAEKAK